MMPGNSSEQCAGHCDLTSNQPVRNPAEGIWHDQLNEVTIQGTPVRVLRGVGVGLLRADGSRELKVIAPFDAVGGYILTIVRWSIEGAVLQYSLNLERGGLGRG